MMRKNLLFYTALTLLAFAGACTIMRPNYIVEYDRVPTTKNQNVCKMLNDSVMVYAVFVDVDIYDPWTEFDVRSTMDSLQKATSWLQAQAIPYGKHVNIAVVKHEQGSKWTFHERRALASLRLNGLVSDKIRKTQRLHPWANAVSKYAGKGVRYKPSGKMATRLKITNKESLVLALRDKYKYENVALMFFVNGYYKNHPSYTFFSATNGPDTEYSIITTKNPAVMAHEILHLFGAVDLYPNKDYPNFNFPQIQAKHPNEIMRIQHKQLDKLNVSPITGYFIGWQDTLDETNTQLLLHKKTLIDY